MEPNLDVRAFWSFWCHSPFDRDQTRADAVAVDSGTVAQLGQYFVIILLLGRFFTKMKKYLKLDMGS